MKTEHYFCDVCKQEFEKGTLVKFCIGIGSPDTSSYSYCSRFNVFKEFELCKNCSEKIGVSLDSEKKELIKEPSIADRLYEIVAEIARTETQY